MNDAGPSVNNNYKDIEHVYSLMAMCSNIIQVIQFIYKDEHYIEQSGPITLPCSRVQTVRARHSPSSTTRSSASVQVAGSLLQVYG